MSNQTTNQLEGLLADAKKKRTNAIKKTVYWTALSPTVVGGIAVFGTLVGSQFENKDLGTIVGNTISASLGGVLGFSGMASAYIDKYKEYIDDIRFALKKVRDYKKLMR